MDNQLKLDKTIGIYKILRNVRGTPAEVQGEVLLDQNLIGVLKEISDEHLVSPNVTYRGNSIPLDRLDPITHSNCEVTIKLTPPRLPKVYFASDLYDLLRIHEFKDSEPQLYYIASEDYCNSYSNSTELVKKYHSTVKFISFLKTCSDHFEKTSDKLNLIFLGKQKLNLPIIYNATDVALFEGLNEFIAYVESSPHKENKLQIFKLVLFDLLINVPDDERFLQLFKYYQVLKDRFNDNYNLFIAELSFEKLKDEVDQRRVDFVQKLNETISQIQNKVLAIPISLLLVATQMRGGKSSLLSNYIILLGSYIFFYFVQLMLKNQRNTLDEIYSAIKYSEENYRQNYASLFIKFEKIYKDLEQRYYNQIFALRAINTIDWISISVSSIIFVFYEYENLISAIQFVARHL